MKELRRECSCHCNFTLSRNEVLDWNEMRIKTKLVLRTFLINCFDETQSLGALAISNGRCYIRKYSDLNSVRFTFMYSMAPAWAGTGSGKKSHSGLRTHCKQVKPNATNQIWFASVSARENHYRIGGMKGGLIERYWDLQPSYFRHQNRLRPGRFCAVSSLVLKTFSSLNFIKYGWD
jgi:hypothetical protein